MSQQAEATVAAHAAIRIIDVMTRQNEALIHGIVTTLDLLERLESHVERVEQRLDAIESHITTTGDNP